MLTLISEIPLRDGGQLSYYSIPARGGESCVRLEGDGFGVFLIPLPSLRGALAWASRRALRQIDILPDGRIRFCPGENG